MELISQKYQCHIFVCVNERAEGECCMQKDAYGILEKLREHVNKKGLFRKYNITKSRCLGHCSEGPTIAIYPQGHIFKKVSVSDCDEIIRRFLPE